MKLCPGRHEEPSKSFLCSCSLLCHIPLIRSITTIITDPILCCRDIIARFGSDTTYRLPREFFDDFVTVSHHQCPAFRHFQGKNKLQARFDHNMSHLQVAEDECRHHELLRNRLENMGSHYGAFAAHEALWDSAMATAHSLPARLAVEHAVHEARG